MQIQIFQSEKKKCCKLQLKLQNWFNGCNRFSWRVRCKASFGGGGTQNLHPLWLALLLSLLIDWNNKNVTIFVGNQRTMWEFGNQSSHFSFSVYMRMKLKSMKFWKEILKKIQVTTLTRDNAQNLIRLSRFIIGLPIIFFTYKDQ